MFPRLSAIGQTIDNTSSYNLNPSPQYIRFHYENDLFAGTDRYYTQGAALEFAHPALKKSPFAKMLIRLPNSKSTEGIMIEQDVYTPTSIESHDILYDDRPFAACLFLKSFAISVDSPAINRLSASFIAGMIGPIAGGYKMQYTIHKVSGNVLPLGWEHQVGNDLILNYALEYERKLLACRGIFSLSGSGSLRIGTLSDKASLGFILQTGNLNAKSGRHNKPKFGFSIYAQPIVSLVGYDATLQGGFYNTTNAYVIPASDIQRITFQTKTGILLRFNRIFISYNYSILSWEFKGGGWHSWGGVSLGVGN